MCPKRKLKFSHITALVPAAMSFGFLQASINQILQFFEMFTKIFSDVSINVLVHCGTMHHLQAILQQ